MTLFLPLEADAPLPQTPAFLLEAADRNAGMAKVVQAVLKAKRIVVICGAGISVRAGIPDFRSSDGLFKTLKRDNPRESLNSGKDLFDASVFNSEHTTSLFCQMMAQLSDMSHNAEPTSFHRLLRALDDRGRLLRVYTQNIDAIEQKSGLSFGVPDFENKKVRARGKVKINKPEETNEQNVEGQQSEASTSRPTTPVPETPRCIPLHGTLQSMHCQNCSNSFPLQDYLPSLTAGQPPQCPECANLERTRALVGKRPRGVGKLRPSVVLYNEAHTHGEGVGNVVQKDLIGSSKGKGRSGVDFLLVVGTSLRIPGTKRMVREFAKAVRSRGGSLLKEETSASGVTKSNNDASRHSPCVDEDPPPAPLKAVYLNLDFPSPTREWEGVFDAWVQGDAQTFADILKEELAKEAKAKELASERKRRREEEAAATVATPEKAADVEMLGAPPKLPTPQSTPKKRGTISAVSPPKRQKMAVKAPKGTAFGVRPLAPPLPHKLASPPQTPPRPSSSSSSCRQEYMGGRLPTPDASPPSQRHWAASRVQSPSAYDPNRSPSRASFPSLNILTSSMRSTLEDHERDCFTSPSLVQVGQCGLS